MTTRFPTLGPGSRAYNQTIPGPPIHPQPGIYETTTAGPDGSITHVEVERIRDRPKWDFEEANLRLFKEKKAREAQAAAAAKAKADRTKNKPTPKRRTPKPPKETS